MLPAPDGTANTRTRLGIYEEVDLKIEPTPPETATINWTTTAGVVTKSLIHGRATLKRVKDPVASFTVTVTVTGDGAGSADKTFSAIIPTGSEVINQQDFGTQGLTPNPNGILLYAGTQFHVQLLPKSVVFALFDFRERVPAVNWTLPSGHVFNQAAFEKAFTLNTTSTYSDTVTTSAMNRSVLIPKGGGAPVGSTYTIQGIEYDYLGAAGWTRIPAMGADHTSTFASDGKGHVTKKENGQAGVDGRTMGPWDP